MYYVIWDCDADGPMSKEEAEKKALSPAGVKRQARAVTEKEFLEIAGLTDQGGEG